MIIITFWFCPKILWQGASLNSLWKCNYGILCHFIFSWWCDCTYHLHPGLLYKRQRVLHRYIPCSNLLGHHASTQHEANGNGGQVCISSPSQKLFHSFQCWGLGYTMTSLNFQSCILHTRKKAVQTGFHTSTFFKLKSSWYKWFHRFSDHTITLMRYIIDLGN